jgi:hypothetical protein
MPVTRVHTVARAGHANAPGPRTRVDHNETNRKIFKFVKETLAETFTVGFGAIGATTSAGAFISSMGVNTLGSLIGALNGTERVRDPSVRISNSQTALRFLIAAAAAGYGARNWNRSLLAKGLFGFGNLFTTAPIIAGAVQVDGIREGAEDAETGCVQRRRSLEWSNGATVGTAVAGTVAVAWGFGLGCGIAAGVVAMKATRAGVRALAPYIIRT